MSLPPSTAPNRFSPRQAGAALGWLLLPLACHFGFSWIGFNPTDDGWMQAVARRLLDGEIPHRDFIFVRPALSALLQVPLVWLGGDHVIWLSRLWGWLTLAGTAWLWSGLALPRHAPNGLRYLLYGSALFLSAHFFPIMAWHSLDGMLLCTAAIWFAARGTPGSLRAAFICAALAALCRQNFALFLPWLFLAIPGREKWRAMLWTALPPLVYAAAMLAAGSFMEFVRQVASPGSSLRLVAWDRFVERPDFLLLILVGAGLAWLIERVRARQPLAGGWSADLAWFGIAAFMAHELWMGPGRFQNATYGLMGLAVGFPAGIALARRSLPSPDRMILVAGLGLAWVVAISIGWNSPALASGLLLLILWRTTHPANETPTPASVTIALVATLLIGASFHHVRQNFVYRDARASELRYDAGEVFPGAAGLRTNQRTHAVLLDLGQIIERCKSEGRPYALLTDGAATWIRSPQRNPLPSDWPQLTEFGYDVPLVEREIYAFYRLPANCVIIVQGIQIMQLGGRIARQPPDDEYFVVQNWLRQNARKTGETAFFELYAPPVWTPPPR